MVPGVSILLMAGVAVAQTAAPGPVFEVASVKPFAPALQRPGVRTIARKDAAPSQFQISGTLVTARGNLMSLVSAAYALERYQVVQSPDWSEQWATSEVWDIEARAPGESVPTAVEVRQMMQALLAERFQLKVSRQNTVWPVYNLVVAPGGSKLKASAFTDTMTRDEGSSGAQIRTRFLDYSIAQLVEQIRRMFDRPLLDKTGLTGGFDFSLAYTAQMPGMTAADAAALGLPDLEPGIPIVASLREQLGLRVVAAKEPIESIVIDHAERPSAN